VLNPSGAGFTLTGTLSNGKFTGTVTADYSTISGQYQASVVGEPATANGTFQGTLCPGTAPGVAGQ